MYYWRAISNFQRFHAPGILTGAVLRDEASDIGPVEELPVVDTPPRRVKPSVLDKVGEALKQPKFLDGDPKPAGSDDPPDWANTKAEREAAQGDLLKAASVQEAAADLKQMAIDAKTDEIKDRNRKIKEIQSFEPKLTTVVWNKVMNDCGFASVKEIGTLEQANKILEAMLAALNW
jgi:hypothetical protein